MLRRFLIWSALAVVVGAVLAGLGIWAYGHFYARFQPVTVQRGQAEIQQMLDTASWVSDGGGGQAVYVVGYRDDGPTMAYLRSEAAKLKIAGVETRILLFAPPDREGLAQSTPAERATIAELWLNRNWALYERWVAAPSASWNAEGIAPADGNLARGAVVDASRRFAEDLNALMRTAGVAEGYPLVLWRDPQGFLKACACSDRRSWVFVRDDFGAPDTVPTTPEAELAPVPPPVTPPVEGAQPLPYPALPTAPGTAPSPQAGTPAPATGQRPATPAPAPSARPQRQTRPGNPTTTPEDTQFY